MKPRKSPKVKGLIIKALSGFYTVHSETRSIECRARGRFRKGGISPLVGDFVEFSENPDGSGNVDAILPRRNAFGRPAVANVDMLVMIVSAAIPVTDPYLIDRVSVRCEKNRVDVLVVINKCDLDPGDKLYEIYKNSGYPTLRVSAATGAGLDLLWQHIQGKTCCFTGNSGVGKSSILNALDASFSIETGEVSQKLGRGRHTTRHVELFNLGDDCYVADTPGFAAFDNESEEPIRKQELATLFPDFADYVTKCRFDDCAHRAEPGCALREALEAGRIMPSRYESYNRMYEEAALLKEWELK